MGNCDGTSSSERARLMGAGRSLSEDLSFPTRARRGLFSELSALIDDQFGGVVTRRDLAILAVARRL
jgi:hypothetical protein